MTPLLFLLIIVVLSGLGYFILELVEKSYAVEESKREYELTIRDMDNLHRERLAIIQRIEESHLDRSLAEVEKEVAKRNKEIN